jgi:tripartite-type tricarboxylate transporter receptor subunit TctC
MILAARFHGVWLRGYWYLLALPAIALWLVAAPAPAAEPWPTRPVTVLCPFAAGTSTDTLMRLVNASLSQRFGQNFIVEDRPGATGNIAAGVVARAEPDGYTLFIGTVGPIVNNKFMYKNLDFDPDRAFAPIALLAFSPLIIVGSPKLPAKNLSELIAYAKAHRGPLNAGTVGVGSQAHITVELLNKAAGITIGHVPYRITSQALPDLASGDLQLSVQYVPTFVPSRACSPASPSPAQNAWPSCRMCRPWRSKAIPGSKPTAGLRCSHRRGRRPTSSARSTRA